MTNSRLPARQAAYLLLCLEESAQPRSCCVTRHNSPVRRIAFELCLKLCVAIDTRDGLLAVSAVDASEATTTWRILRRGGRSSVATSEMVGSLFRREFIWCLRRDSRVNAMVVLCGLTTNRPQEVGGIAGSWHTLSGGQSGKPLHIEALGRGRVGGWRALAVIGGGWTPIRLIAARSPRYKTAGCIARFASLPLMRVPHPPAGISGRRGIFVYKFQQPHLSECPSRRTPATPASAAGSVR